MSPRFQLRALMIFAGASGVVVGLCLRNPVVGLVSCELTAVAIYVSVSYYLMVIQPTWGRFVTFLLGLCSAIVLGGITYIIAMLIMSKFWLIR